jgi:hypothetical protein
MIAMLSSDARFMAIWDMPMALSLMDIGGGQKFRSDMEHSVGKLTMHISESKNPLRMQIRARIKSGSEKWRAMIAEAKAKE